MIFLTQFLELGSQVISNVSILYCLAHRSTKFNFSNLGLLIFIDVAFLLYCYFIYRTIVLYLTISLLKYVCVCVCVFICSGHHDSNRMAGLVMVLKAESIVLYK